MELETKKLIEVFEKELLSIEKRREVAEKRIIELNHEELKITQKIVKLRKSL